MPSTSEIVERLASALSTHDTEITAAYLFGSIARGAARATSDIDVGLLFREEPPATLAGLRLDLEAELERAVGAPVQLVILNRAPSDLVHRALRDGILLLDRDPSRRIRFEVRARNEYFDLKPHLDRYRRISPAARR
jgi:predicted nucleotidyltransferase